MAIRNQRKKYVEVIRPAAILDNNTFAEVEIDTVGFDHCNVVAYIGFVDIGITVLKVQETDVSVTGEVDITGLEYAVSNDITGTLSVLPTATDDNKFFLFEIDLRGRKRFLQLVCTIGDGATGGFVTAWAELSRSEEGPFTAADKGVASVLRV